MQNLKDVLFGQQKQSDGINTTITRMIYNVLISGGYDVGHHDIKVVEDEVRRYVTAVSEGSPTLDNDIFELIVGPESVAVLNSGVPYYVSAEPVSAESTKVKFRIYATGAEVEAPEPELSTLTADYSKQERNDNSVNSYEQFSFYQQACALRDEIIPTASAAARAELQDEPFALALVCAKAYWGV